MASVNKVTLIGNLGRDPETRTMPSGGTVCNLAVATTETWKDRQSGERREQTEWHRVVMFERLADIAAQYLRKGSQVYIEGRLQTRKWQDKDGQDRYTTEIRATEMKMLGSKAEGASPAPSGRAEAPSRAPDHYRGEFGTPPQMTRPDSGPNPASRQSAAPAYADDFDVDIPF